MDFKKIKVYHLFWIVAGLILLIGLSEMDNTFDINIYDTYYVIPSLYGTVVLFLFYFLMGLGYWLVQKVYKKQLIKSLTIIHSVILIGSYLFYRMLIYYSKPFFREIFPFLGSNELINATLVVELLLIVLIGMPVYIVNLLIAIFRKKNVS